MSDTTLTADLVGRSTDETVQTFDLTGYTPRQIERFWDGLVLKVDFERYRVSPDLETLQQLAADECEAPEVEGFENDAVREWFGQQPEARRRYTCGVTGTDSCPSDVEKTAGCPSC